MAGRYQAYQEYKDSGVKWLGEIPEHWSASTIKYLSNSVGTGGTPKESSSFCDTGGVCWFTPGDLVDGRILVKSVKNITHSSCDNGDAKKYDGGSVLVIGIGATLGKVGYCLETFSCNQQINVIKPNNKAIGMFMKYSLLIQTEQMKQLSNASTIGIMNQEKTKLIKIAAPSITEQTQIANFLDHETAKIDTLISRQEQLIKLLKEKRQAVISHAVTKGLNSAAPMRNSGVEWLGEVPEHWVVNKFGYISLVVRGGSPRPAGDPTLFNGDYSPWVTVAEITKDEEIYLTETETFLTKKGSDQCRVFATGTLLLSNSGATLGVPKILTIDANANDGVVGFERLSLNHEFAYFYLSTLTEDLRERIKQGSGQPNLNTDIIKDIVVPIPPKNEADEIVNAIHKTRAKFQKLSNKAQKGIELLHERRTALISAAVTGKIDLRTWQAPSKSEKAMEATHE